MSDEGERSCWGNGGYKGKGEKLWREGDLIEDGVWEWYEKMDWG